MVKQLIDDFKNLNLLPSCVISFCIGISFSLLSKNLLLYLSFCIAYEAVILMSIALYKPWDRLSLFISGLVGWIVGRVLFNHTIM